MDTEEEDLKRIFFLECEELLGNAEQSVESLRSESAPEDAINALFRAVHSIKGGAGAFGLEQLVRFAHTFETSLDLVRSGKVNATRSILKTMLTAADTLADLVRSAREGTHADDAEITRMVQQLEAACGPAAPEAPRPGQ